jgi:hypothetical protein
LLSNATCTATARLIQEARLAQLRAEESEAKLEMLLASQEDELEIGEERVAAYVKPLGPRCDTEESLVRVGTLAVETPIDDTRIVHVTGNQSDTPRE